MLLQLKQPLPFTICFVCWVNMYTNSTFFELSLFFWEAATKKKWGDSHIVSPIPIRVLLFDLASREACVQKTVANYTQVKPLNGSGKFTYLVLQTTIFYWMFGETTISYVKNWNHPVETTTNKWMFGVPGKYWTNPWKPDFFLPFMDW